MSYMDIAMIIMCIYIQDETVLGGNNGSFKDTNYFSCEDGYGLYLPYEMLKRDDRFPSGKPNDLNFESPLSSNGNQKETVFNISSDNGQKNITEL